MLVELRLKISENCFYFAKYDAIKLLELIDKYFAYSRSISEFNLPMPICCENE